LIARWPNPNAVTRIFDMALSGHHFFVTGAGGILSFDARDESTLAIQGAYITSGEFRCLHAEGDRLYAAGKGIVVFDVSDPCTLRPVAHYLADQDIKQLRVVYPMGYAIAFNGSVFALNLEAPQSTAPARGIVDTDRIYDIAASTKHLFRANRTDLTCFDLENPLAPREIARYPLAAHNPVLAASDFILVHASHDPISPDPATGADWMFPFHFFTVGDDETLQLRAKIFLDECPTRMLIRGHRLFALGHSALLIIDIADPNAPKLISRVGDYQNLRNFAINDGAIVLSDGYDRITALHPSGDSYRVQATYDAKAARFQAVHANRRFFFSSSDEPPEVYALRPSGTTNLLTVGKVAAAAKDLFATDDTLFLASGRTGLQLFDIRDANSMTMAGAYQSTGGTLCVFGTPKVAYLASEMSYSERSGLFEILDVSDPKAIARLGSCPIQSRSDRLFVDDNKRAYNFSGTNAFQIIDVSDVHHPRVVHSTLFASNSVMEFVMLRNSAQDLFAILSADRHSAWSVMGRGAPADISARRMAQLKTLQPQKAFLDGNLLYRAEGRLGVEIWDLCETDPEHQAEEAAAPGQAVSSRPAPGSSSNDGASYPMVEGCGIFCDRVQITLSGAQTDRVYLEYTTDLLSREVQWTRVQPTSERSPDGRRLLTCDVPNCDSSSIFWRLCVEP
jgi:hypothetical protein